MRKPRGKTRLKQMRPPFCDNNEGTRPDKIFFWCLCRKLGWYGASLMYQYRTQRHQVRPRQGFQNQIVPV